MSILVIAEHDNVQMKAATLNVVAAASKIGGDIHILVAGANAAAVAQHAAKITGVSKVLLAESPALADGLAENVAEQVLALAPAYSHILFAATASGKNVSPRVAARLDVAQNAFRNDISVVLAASFVARGHGVPNERYGASFGATLAVSAAGCPALVAIARSAFEAIHRSASLSASASLAARRASSRRARSSCSCGADRASAASLASLSATAPPSAAATSSVWMAATHRASVMSSGQRMSSDARSG